MESVLKFIDKAGDVVVDLQRSLVAIPALGPENGGQGEKEKAEYLMQYLRDLGFTDIVEINAPDKRVACGFRPNISAVLPGRNTDKTLWVISHMDVVPSGDLALWDSAPFELRVEGDVMYGRGVEDNHQGIVSSLVAARAILETGEVPSMNLGLLLVADEETGSGMGLDYVLKEKPGLFSKDDLFLVPDFGNAESTMLEVAEKSMFWLKFSVKGKQCHASTPQEGINSLLAASALVLRLRDLHGEFNAVDDLFSPGHSTFEATKKEANVPNVNTIPGLDVFYLDCRVLPDYPLAEVEQAIIRMYREIETQYSVRIEHSVVQKQESAPKTPVDSEIVQSLVKAVRRVYGVEAKPAGIGGGTVAAFLRRQGYPAAVWATCVHNAHQPNESSTISGQLGDAKVIAHMLFS